MKGTQSGSCNALLLSAGLGFFAGAVASGSISVASTSLLPLDIATGCLIAVSAAGAARAVKKDQFNNYQVLNGVLWVALFAGFSLVYGRPSSTVVIAAGKGWGLTTIIGAAFAGVKMYLLSKPATPTSKQDLNATASA
jgi:hypothetical protein